MKPLHAISFFLVILFALSYISNARDIITPTQPLRDNETLVSSGGNFVLGFFTSTNNRRYVGLWYNKISIRTILWVANRDNPVVNSVGLLSITSKGVLTITEDNSTVVWSVNTTGLDSPVAQLLDTGNLVLKLAGDSSENYAWQGFDYPTDTLIPRMKVGWSRSPSINRTITAWKSENDPSNGDYYIFMDIHGDPELYLCSEAKKIWRSGPWNGLEFSGAPDSYYHPFNYSFVISREEMTYSYDVLNPSTVSRVVLTPSGSAQHQIWQSESSQWSVFWYALQDSCDNFEQCGPYGACDANSLPTCECLLQPAFTPKNPTNWGLKNNADGCIRKTGLDCENGTDGFVPVSNAKLPQTMNSMMDMSLSLDECRALCLMNCSCTAYANALVTGGGSGCIIWVSELLDIRFYAGAGQDLYVRLAAADIASVLQSQNHKPKWVAIIVSLISATLLLSCVGCFLWRRKKRRRVLLDATNFFSDEPNQSDRGKDLNLPLLDFGTIAAATDNFSDRNKLGQGGFGPVYKGKLGEDQEIAVKRLAKTSGQGTEEFKNEVMLIAKLQNRNLVRLLGCCVQGEERMLVYEYMANRSLDAFLFVKEKAALDWRTRYHIIVGVTRGLLYLHHDSRYRIIHRDLKASNILLDKEMNPKISDFGMARLFCGDETDYNTRKVVGTYGYMSPEYAMHGIFSLKSDVFSFGVLLLEIVSGKRNRGTSHVFSLHIYLLAHAWSLWNEGQSLNLVDESMSVDFPADDVLKCIKVGLLCVQEHPEDRPFMSSVIEMLGADVTYLPQPKQPGFIARMSSLDLDQIQSNQEPYSANEVTVSLDGR